jgi:hypothetical protein
VKHHFKKKIREIMDRRPTTCSGGVTATIPTATVTTARQSQMTLNPIMNMFDETPEKRYARV